MVGDRVVSADAFPIGIDYNKFTSALDDPAVTAETDLLNDHYRDKRIILSVDRLDYSKGIPNRLRAFEEFLQQNPEYHKKVSLVVIAVPSRVEVQAYKNLRDTIEQMVSRINGTYATVDWTPISYQFKNIPFEQLVALYKKADVALVTPLRDGMNLVAKEYIACKQATPGVLVLSEFAGAADELQEAILINPNNLDAVVGAIKQALSMPEKQQKQRLLPMQRRISQYTIQRCAKNVQKDRNSKLLTTASRRKIVTAFQQAKHRALFLDYDGCLVELIDSPDPAEATPPDDIMEMLGQFANLPNTSLFIISGRTKVALQSWFADLPVTLIAEHGSWIRQGQEWVQKQHLFGHYREQLRTILQQFMERTPGSYLEEKEFSLVWHYRNVSPELAYARNASLRHELNTILPTDSEVGVFSGNKIIEIKPRSIRKGSIVTELLRSNPSDFVLCAGDDYTDEDMFQALPNAYTLKVGYDETSAHYQVGSVKKLRILLEMLLSS
jgi:trehalose 6-phosphate synthase/phosphatase